MTNGVLATSLEPLDKSGHEASQSLDSRLNKVIDSVSLLSVTVYVTCICETVRNDTVLTTVW